MASGITFVMLLAAFALTAEASAFDGNPIPYFNCPSFGLISAHGKFLSAQPNGVVEWNRDAYDTWEHITFQRYLDSNVGFLKSVHGKELAATPSGRLEWDRAEWDGVTWETFDIATAFYIHQHEGKISLRSVSLGMYLSAQEDGTVEVDRKVVDDWEWFTVYPQSCLNCEIEICEKGIDTSNYDAESVVYHTTEGSVEAFPPEQVGFQHIENEGSSITQSTAFTVSETVTETASFTHTGGASITHGTEFSVGLPIMASGSVSLDVSVSYEFSAGEESSVEKQMTAIYNCAAPAGKTVTCKALLFKYQMTVPYTQTWRHKTLGCSCQTEGEFKEVAASEMKLTVDEQDVIVTTGEGGFHNIA